MRDFLRGLTSHGRSDNLANLLEQYQQETPEGGDFPARLADTIRSAQSGEDAAPEGGVTR